MDIHCERMRHKVKLFFNHLMLITFTYVLFLYQIRLAQSFSTVCSDTLYGGTNSCNGDIFLLGANLNIGVHRVGSFGTSHPVQNVPYYSSNLSCIANIYHANWSDYRSSKSSSSDDGEIQSDDYYDYAEVPTSAPTIPIASFAGDFFVPLLPLEGINSLLSDLCILKHVC